MHWVRSTLSYEYPSCLISYQGRCTVDAFLPQRWRPLPVAEFPRELSYVETCAGWFARVRGEALWESVCTRVLLHVCSSPCACLCVLAPGVSSSWQWSDKSLYMTWTPLVAATYFYFLWPSPRFYSCLSQHHSRLTSCAGVRCCVLKASAAAKRTGMISNGPLIACL